MAIPNTDDPIALFAAWYDDVLASDILNPTAMTLATADGDGRPTARMVEKLRVGCGEISDVLDWPGFFSRLGLPLPSQCQVATRLRNAVVNSATKGYHGSRTDGRHGASRRQGERQPPRRR